MSRVPSVDVAIVGRGVAAAAAVLALRDSGLGVCVIAPGRKTGDRVGETLSPAANSVLRELRILDRFMQQGHRPAHTTFSSWGSDELVERHSMLNADGAGWHLDRNRFESFLWKLAVGVVAADVAAPLVRAERTPSGWLLTARNSQSMLARFVIDASGRGCTFARRQSSRHRSDKLFAATWFLSQVDRDVSPTPATLIEARPDGWWYSALLPDGRLVVCGFTDHDLLPAGVLRDPMASRRWVEKSTWTARRIRSAGFALAGAPSWAPATSVWLDAAAGDDWAAAGDAAAAFDPLSSHGLTTALWSGRRSALAATATLAGDDRPLGNYAAAVRAGVMQFGQQRRRVYALEHRFRENPFWQRRIGDADHGVRLNTAN